MRLHLVIFAIVSFAIAAHADAPKDQARKLVAEAEINYKLGKFEIALAGYSKAYELYPVAPLLFNIGQCHRELKHYERAVFFYEGYLRESPKDASNRVLVESLLVEMRKAAELQASSATKADEQRRRDQEAERQRVQADAQRREQQRRDEAEQRRIEQARRDRADQERRDGDKLYKKWWFWGAVGSAIAIGGTAYYLSGSTTVVPPSGSLGGLDRR